MLTSRIGRFQSLCVRPLIFCLLLLSAILAAGPAYAGSWSVTATLTGGATPSGSGQLSYKWPGSFSTGGSSQVPGALTATYSQSLVMPNPRPSQPESGAATLNVNAQIVFTLTWVPANNNAQTDPPPPYVTLYYGRQVQASAQAENSANGEVTAGSASGGIGPITNSASASGAAPGQLVTDTSPPVSDPILIGQVLATNGGSAQISFSVSGIQTVHVIETVNLSGSYRLFHPHLRRQPGRGRDRSGSLRHALDTPRRRTL